MTSDFGKSLTASLLLHGAIVLLLGVRMILAPNIPMDIRQAIRVDVVDLPDKLIAPPKVVEAPPAPVPSPTPPAPPKEALPAKVEPAKPKVPNKVDLAKNQKKALDQLKAMQALDKIKEEVSDAEKKKASSQIKGAQISKGTALTGLEKIEYDRYFDQIKSRVLENWNLPQWLADADLKAQALVMLDENGMVTQKRILRSSGNSVFDSNVLEAVEKSSPFPAPPSRLRGVMAAQGVVFNFPVQ